MEGRPLILEASIRCGLCGLLRGYVQAPQLQRAQACVFVYINLLCAERYDGDAVPIQRDLENLT